MKNCQNCGTPIPKEFQTEKSPLCDYCSRECYEFFMREPKGAKPLEVKEKVFGDSPKPLTKEQKTPQKAQGINIDGETILMLRSGSSSRGYNIQAVMNLLEKGYNPQQITFALELYFKQNTIAEYINIANTHLKNKK